MVAGTTMGLLLRLRLRLVFVPVRSRWVGVWRSLLPASRPCPSTFRWARATTHRSKQTTAKSATISSVHCVNSLLSCPLTLVNSARVIAKGLGCRHRLAQPGMAIVAPPRPSAPFSFCGTFTAETTIQNIGDKFSKEKAIMCVFFFNAGLTPTRRFLENDNRRLLRHRK